MAKARLKSLRDAALGEVLGAEITDALAQLPAGRLVSDPGQDALTQVQLEAHRELQRIRFGVQMMVDEDLTDAGEDSA